MAAVSAASTAIVALTKQSIESYAEYEQLVGGAELMFGKAYDIVAENAKNAYKTVQMSQNEYLAQVNGFAVGLKTSLNGNEQAAADLAHKIIQAEADIVAATGESQENIQNAFNGIMKSNYNMLDNLKLGITPTKEGFAEVIDKVNEWNATNGKATRYQMGNLADMQAALVDYVDMVGMKGYAEREAAQTIQGSLASTKAAWSNLITGLADENANFEELVESLVTSLVGDGTETNKGLFGNIMPRIEVALGGIGDLIARLAPFVVEQIPVLVDSVLPSMIEAVVGLVTAIGTTLTDNAPLLIQHVLDLVLVLGQGLVENAPALVESVIQTIESIAMWLAEYSYVLIDGAIALIVSLANMLVENLPELIPSIIYLITEIVETLTNPDNLALLLDAALAIIWAIAEGLIQSLPNLVTALTDIIDNIVSFFTDEEQRKKVGDTALDLG
ncbi:MAG: hypothetical protein U0L88_06410, partial [Acutalibacteraceae bacterium]|nr:hypothetical protein [Acutalibacteraceae bacterium]